MMSGVMIINLVVIFSSMVSGNHVGLRGGGAVGRWMGWA